MAARNLDQQKLAAITDLGSHFAQLAFLEKKQVIALMEHSEYLELNKNQILLSENEHNHLIYFIISGNLELYTSRGVGQRFSNLGDSVGELSASSHQRSRESVRATQPTQVIIFDLKSICSNTMNFRLEACLFKILCAGLELRLRQSHDKTREFDEATKSLASMTIQLQEAEKKLIQTNAEKKLNLSEKKILICEEQKKFHPAIRSSLMGSGAKIYLTESYDEAVQTLAAEDYDAVIATPESLELLRLAKQKFPLVKTILNSPLENAQIAKLLQEEDFIDNVHLTQEIDRTHFIKTLTTTLHKMLQKDIFGAEKYLNTGAQIHCFAVTSSFDRTFLKERLETFLTELNVRKTVADRCLTVCDELLMNAIFDAPTTTEGKSKFNHLARTEHIELQPREQGQFFFACDGVTVLIGIQDPFGSLEKDTVIRYLHRNYNQSSNEKQDEAKGGGGHGFHLMVETADMLVVNVKKQWKSEVIALFQMPTGAGKEKVPNRFQLFFED